MKKGTTIIRVWDQDPGTGQTYLDLYDKISISATYQFSNVQDFSKTNSNFSKSFRIPATENNISFFGPIFDTNAEGSFNPKKKASCVIEYETIPQLSGYLQLKNVIIQKGRYSEFEIIVFGEVATLGAGMADKKISDYTTYLDTLDHEFNSTNVLNSWTNTLFGGKVVYPLADYGAGLNAAGSGIGLFADITSPIQTQYFKPMLKLRDLMDGIFEEEGFTYNSDFFTNDPMYNSLVVSCKTNAAWNFTEGVIASNQRNATLTSNSNHTDSFLYYGDVRPVPVFSIATIDGGFDPSGSTGIAVDAQGFTFQYYEVTVPGQHFVQYRGRIRNDGGIINNQKTIGMMIEKSPDILFTSGNTTFHDADFNSIGNGATDTVQNMPGAHSFTTAVIGEYYRLVVSNNTGGSINNQQWNFSYSATPVDPLTGQILLYETGPGAGGAYWRVFQNSPQIFGNTVVMSEIAPDMKAIDLLTSLTKMFNLIIEADKDVPTRLNIEPYSTWIDSGDVVDWTDKLDIKKDYQLKPTTDLQNGTLNFTYKEEKDILNVISEAQANRIYGRKYIDQVGSDFAKGEKKIEVEFSPTPCNTISGHDAIIPKFFDSTGLPIEVAPRILVWSGLVSCADWYFRTDAGVTQLKTSYPRVGHYQNPTPTVLDYDINFGVDVPFHPVSGIPFQTLYYKYWEKYIAELYDSTSRIMIGNFQLDTEDIFSFKFNDKIWIKDSYWRINKINGFAINSNDSTKVELIKLPSKDVECEWVPDSSSLTGQILFTNGILNNQTGTQSCCTAYGYIWQYANGSFGCYVPTSSNISGGSGSLTSGNTPGQGIVTPRLLSPESEGLIIGTKNNIQNRSGVTLGSNNLVYQENSIVQGNNNSIQMGSTSSRIYGSENEIFNPEAGRVTGLQNIGLTSNGIQISGDNSRAWRQGERVLGGSNYQDRTIEDERIGRSQHGTLIFSFEGGFIEGSERGSKVVPIYLQGKETNLWTLENLSAWRISGDLIMCQERGSFTTLNISSYTGENIVWRDSGGYRSISPDFSVIKQLGVNGINIKLVLVFGTDIKMFLQWTGKGSPPEFVAGTVTISYDQINPHFTIKKK